MNRLLASVEVNQVPLGIVPEHVLYQEVDGEVVVLDLSSGDYYDFNEVGSVIWSLLLECQDFDQVMEKLVQKFDANAKMMHADLIAFIEKLLAAGLMELRNYGSSRFA
jgi:hypothetical protein